MTIITEHRWQCDYCEVVSPVVTRNVYELTRPKGWVTENEITGWCLFEMYTFCCEAHKDIWLEERKRE